MHNDPKNQQDTENTVDEESPSEETQAFDADQTVVMTETDFANNAGGASGEPDIDDLVAEVDAEADPDVARKQDVRRRLEKIAEGQSFEDTYAVEFEKK